MATIEPSWFEFKDGRAFLVVNGSRRSELGKYLKRDGEWLLISRNETNFVRANFWGITLKSLDSSWSKTMPRIIWR